MFTRRQFLKFFIGSGISLMGIAGWPVGAEIPAAGLAKSSPLLSEAAKNKVTPVTDVDSIREAVATLSAVPMDGREAGTLGEANAAKYLEGQLRALCLEPLGEVGYEQVFIIPQVKKTVVEGRVVFVPGSSNDLRAPAVNLLAKLAGTKSKQYVLLCAHYDHLGIYQGRIYPGANDNASGVACILEVVRHLKQLDASQRSNIIVAFWSAEEMGFVGSNAFSNSPTVPLNTIKAVINVDTVGNGKPGNFGFWAQNKNVAVTALSQAAQSIGKPLGQVPTRGHNSDHISFANVAVPAVTLLSRDWLVNNHTVRDTPDKVDFDQIATASEIVYRAARLLM